MLLDLFNRAHKALTDASSQDAERCAAFKLTEGSLFPITDCFNTQIFHEQSDGQKRPIATSDQASVLLIINDLFSKEDERFGDTENRKKIKQRIDKVVKNSGNIFSGAAKIFEELCPTALKDITIALVGMDSPEHLKSFLGEEAGLYSAQNQPLLKLFGHVYDFYPERSEDAFSLGAIETNHPETKVDYVVTANVLNDLFHSRSEDNVFLAAGRMLKKGGKAIHLLGYSNDFYELHINNPTLVGLAGQQRTAALPSQHDMQGCLDFVMFEQMEEIRISEGDVKEIMLRGPCRRLAAKGNTHFYPYLKAEHPSDVERWLGEWEQIAFAMPTHRSRKLLAASR